MQCEECGLLLDSVDESQTEHIGRYRILFCEKHKPFEFLVA